MILGNNLLRGQPRVGDVPFQIVPTTVVHDFLLVDANANVLINVKKLIVSILVHLILRQCSPGKDGV